MNLIRRLFLAFTLMAGITPVFAQVPAPVPALPDSERRTSYSISGTTCACNVNFALFGDGADFNNWVEVYINGVRYNFNDATHGWTITSPSGSLSTLPRPITNAVLTFNAVQTGTVQIVGARRPRRTSQFSENTGVSARNFNQVLTDIISQNREIWDKTNDMTGRGLFGLPGETIGSLPSATARAGALLAFDVSGNPVATTPGAGTGNVIGPASSTNNDLACWNGATGALLKDCGTIGQVLDLLGSTQGQVLYRGASGWTVLAPGTNGQLLASGGPAANVSWATAAGTGTVTSVTAGTGLSATPNPIVGAGTINFVVPVATANGGTGVVSPTANTIPINQGASAQTNTGTGTLGQALISNGAGADPSFKHGGRTLLNTLTASNSVTLADTTSLTSSYSNYEIVFENILPATNTQTCQLQINSGGVKSTTYLSIVFGANAVGAITNATSTAAILCSSALHVSNAGTGVNGFCRVSNPSQTTSPKMFVCTFSYTSTTGSIEMVSSSGYWNGGNGAVTGFQVSQSSGNLTSGTVRIYGWN